jgi:hypothetical protein
MSRANSLAPLLAVGVLVLGLLAWYGPGWYRLWRFNQACQAMLSSARAGQTNQLLSYVEPAQQQQVGALLQRWLPANYQDKIVRLKLSSWKQRGEKTIYAIVTCRVNHGEGEGLYQGKLRWDWDGRQWNWDFLGSYGAEFALQGEPDWVSLSQLMTLAELL